MTDILSMMPDANPAVKEAIKRRILKKAIAKKAIKRRVAKKAIAKKAIKRRVVKKAVKRKADQAQGREEGRQAQGRSSAES